MPRLNKRLSRWATCLGMGAAILLLAASSTLAVYVWNGNLATLAGSNRALAFFGAFLIGVLVTSPAVILLLWVDHVLYNKRLARMQQELLATQRLDRQADSYSLGRRRFGSPGPRLEGDPDAGFGDAGKP